MYMYLYVCMHVHHQRVQNIYIFFFCRNCTTRRKVAGSIPDRVIEIFLVTILPVAAWTWSRLSL
jgi:hypothetical protein